MNKINELIRQMPIIQPGVVPLFCVPDGVDTILKEVQMGVARRIRCTKPFRIAHVVVQRWLWYQVMKTTPWVDYDQEMRAAGWRGELGDDCPATNMTPMEADLFCERLSKLLKLKCALPTELQWELVANDGKRTVYYWGDNCDDDNEVARAYAHYRRDGAKYGDTYLIPAGSLRPTVTGVYDMVGLVSEWVRDRVSCKPRTIDFDWSKVPMSGDDYWSMTGDRRIMRGGSFVSSLSACAPFLRYLRSDGSREVDTGFRFVIED